MLLTDPRLSTTSTPSHPVLLISLTVKIPDTSDQTTITSFVPNPETISPPITDQIYSDPAVIG
jgi:hypothetical protein